MSDTVRPHRWQPTRLPPSLGILQARTLECIAISFSNAWKWSEKEVAQSCPTLSDPMDYSLPGSSIHGIFQARVLEWGAIAFSNKIVYTLFYLEPTKRFKGSHCKSCFPNLIASFPLILRMYVICIMLLLVGYSCGKIKARTHKKFWEVGLYVQQIPNC